MTIERMRVNNSVNYINEPKIKVTSENTQPKIEEIENGEEKLLNAMDAQAMSALAGININQADKNLEYVSQDELPQNSENDKLLTDETIKNKTPYNEDIEDIEDNEYDENTPDIENENNTDNVEYTDSAKEDQ